MALQRHASGVEVGGRAQPELKRSAGFLLCEAMGDVTYLFVCGCRHSKAQASRSQCLRDLPWGQPKTGKGDGGEGRMGCGRE